MTAGSLTGGRSTTERSTLGAGAAASRGLRGAGFRTALVFLLTFAAGALVRALTTALGRGAGLAATFFLVAALATFFAGLAAALRAPVAEPLPAALGRGEGLEPLR